MAAIELLDGKTTVSVKELALNLLKTALLSLEKAAIMNFELSENNNELYLNPTGIKNEFPIHTLEERLIPIAKIKLSTHIEDWLQYPSKEPANRTVEMVKLMLALRGLATSIDYKDFSLYKYSEKALELIQNKREDCTEINDLLNHCEQTRPELWNLLDSEILLAFKNKTHKGNDQSKYIEPSPWQNESQSHQLKFLGTGNYTQGKNGAIISIIFISVLSYLWYKFVIRKDPGITFHLIEAGIILLVFSLITLGALFKIKQIVFVVDGIKEILPPKIKLNLYEEQTASMKLWANINGVFFAGFITHLVFYLCYDSRFWQIISLITLVSVFLKIVRVKAKKAINDKVLGKPVQPIILNEMTSSPSIEIGVDSGLENKVEEVNIGTSYQKISLNIIYTDKLVESTRESQRAIANVLQRRPAYAQLLRMILLFLITGTFIGGIVVWFINGNKFSNTADGAFDFKNIYTFITVYIISLVLTIRGVVSWISSLKFIQNLKIKWFNITQQNRGSQVENKSIAKEVNSPRPVLFIIMFWIWLMISINLITSQYLIVASYSIKILLTGINLALISLSFWQFYQGRKKLEENYPYQPPLNMLALRVFGSPYLTDFLKLTNLWQYMGTIQRLDGPETTGERTSDIYNYLFNKIEDSIVEDEIELKLEMQKMKTLPDKNLRFSLNSMQCTDNSWKQALHALIEEADLVVMDFSNLSEKNKGVVFELHKLFEEFPIKRTVMLINDSCDYKVLEEITTQAWNLRTEKSPNFGLDVSELVFYHTGVMPLQRENESIYEWKKRFQIPIDSEKLVGVLLDKAIPKRKPIVIQSLKENAKIKKWTKLPISKWISIPIKIFIAIYFISSIYQIVTNLF